MNKYTLTFARTRTHPHVLLFYLHCYPTRHDVVAIVRDNSHRDKRLCKVDLQLCTRSADKPPPSPSFQPTPGQSAPPTPSSKHLDDVLIPVILLPALFPVFLHAPTPYVLPLPPQRARLQLQPLSANPPQKLHLGFHSAALQTPLLLLDGLHQPIKPLR